MMQTISLVKCKREALRASRTLNKVNVLHHSMQPQNCDFNNSYIYISYYQSNIYFYSTPKSASFLHISN